MFLHEYTAQRDFLAPKPQTGVTSLLNRPTKRGNHALQATYNGRDPRPFYRCQSELDYRIPELSAVLVRTLAQKLTSGRGITVVDMGCSYGISSAVITCDLTLEEIYQNYVGPDRATLSVADLQTEDRRWFERHRSADLIRMFGFDVSANAVKFACTVGLLDRGWVCDLERQEPPADLASAMREVDLVMGTGVVSYITPRTLQRLLATRPDPPWILTFPLRLSDYHPFSATLAQHGLRTMRLNTHPIVQQRVGSAGEQNLIAEHTGQRPSVAHRNGHEYYLADCFLSMPDDRVGVTAALTARLRRTLDSSPLSCVA